MNASSKDYERKAIEALTAGTKADLFAQLREIGTAQTFATLALVHAIRESKNVI